MARVGSASGRTQRYFPEFHPTARMMAAPLRLLSIVLMTVASSPALARWESVDFSQAKTPHDCDTLISASPSTYSAYSCYDLVARRYGQWEEMARHVEGRLSLEPENYPLKAALGFIETDRGHERAVDLFQEAARGFASKNDPGGECLARIDLSVLWLNLGQIDKAASQLDEAERLAWNEELRLKVLNARAEYHHRKGEEARALALRKEVEAAVFPEGPPYLQ